MATEPKLMTAEEFAELEDNGLHYELVRGELRPEIDIGRPRRSPQRSDGFPVECDLDDGDGSVDDDADGNEAGHQSEEERSEDDRGLRRTAQLARRGRLTAFRTVFRMPIFLVPVVILSTHDAKPGEAQSTRYPKTSGSS